MSMRTFSTRRFSTRLRARLIVLFLLAGGFAALAPYTGGG